jgi:CPA1 family monovalent cation:H+ antiporter
VLPTLLVVTVGSVVLGLALSPLTLAVNARITDVATAVVVQFCTTFGVWMLAERLHLSGIITLVVFAMAASRRAPEIMPARIRIPAWAVWEVAVFVLNVLAFILVGFQLKSIAARAIGATGSGYAMVAVAVCVAVILARIAWVMGATAFRRWRSTARGAGLRGQHDAAGLSMRSAMVVGWCGMRGTVTLAAALALPTGGEGGSPFPYRDLIVVTAFGVVLGTLVVQGLTLRPLLLRLRLEDDGMVEREIHFARVETLRAAVEAAQACPGAETAKLVHYRYEFQLRRAEEEFARDRTDMNGVTSEGSIAPGETTQDIDRRNADAAVVRTATEAQRQRLVALRADGSIGDAAFQRVEEELDWAELDWAQLLRVGQSPNEEA